MEDQDYAKTVMQELRAAFSNADWQTVPVLYERLVPSIGKDRGLRVEAGCLAARALTASKERSRARSILRNLTEGTYRRPAHYEFLARAWLDLKNYEEAAKACLNAEERRKAEEPSS
jgi:hypothetical protein